MILNFQRNKNVSNPTDKPKVNIKIRIVIDSPKICHTLSFNNLLRKYPNVELALAIMNQYYIV